MPRPYREPGFQSGPKARTGSQTPAGLPRDISSRLMAGLVVFVLSHGCQSPEEGRRFTAQPVDLRVILDTCAESPNTCSSTPRPYVGSGLIVVESLAGDQLAEYDLNGAVTTIANPRSGRFVVSAHDVEHEGVPYYCSRAVGDGKSRRLEIVCAPDVIS
jgi:hypothetical protein